MTREEAIRIIETVFQDEYVYKYYDSITHQALDMAIEALHREEAEAKGYCHRIKPKEYSSADAEQGYTEWLEKVIVDNGANEWLCEDTPDTEWCKKNCHYSSIQAECLRHLYEVSKGGKKYA